MKPNDQVSEVSQKAVITLANELGSRLKRDIGAEVEEMLDQFLKEMKESPQKILSESDAQQVRILKLLDERLHNGENEGTKFEQELERLMKKAETRLKEKIEAEKKAETVFAEKTAVEKEKEVALLRAAEAESRVGQALREKTRAEELHQVLLDEKTQVEQELAELKIKMSKESDELKASIQTYQNDLDEALNLAETRLKEKVEAEKIVETVFAEKTAAEEKTEAALLRAVEAEKKLQASDLLNETLKEKLKSSKKVFKIVAVILSIITLAIAGYAIFRIQNYHAQIKGMDRLVEKQDTGIDKKDGFIDALNRSQAPMHAELAALKQNETLPVQNINRPIVKLTLLPEPKTVSYRISSQARPADRPDCL